MASVKPAGVPKAPGHKSDFNAMPAPANYVPGLGRGATGFTTRSDIGPARMGPPGAGGDEGGGAGAAGAGEEVKFDSFMGSDAGMFASYGEYDEEDRDADRVWEGVDAYMDERRREHRERRLKEELEKYRAENPKITEQFADLKRRLADVSETEWEAIPDIGDYTVKKQRRMTFAPAPDSLLAKAAAASETATSIDKAASAIGGLATPLGGGATTVSDLTAIGQGQRTVIELKLDSMADSVSGQTVVDPKGYLTDLKTMQIDSATEVADLKKARELLRSVITTNPRHAPGWIAAARLEARAKKMAEARTLIAKGCELCPASEDVWLEASSLEKGDAAKAALARGVVHLPNSVRLWMAAAALEQDDAAKARVLRKALERIPNSVRLWKAAVELANEADARILLSRAVECCPQHTELWLALARLESYDNAKKVLNKARQAVPTDASIWITAAKLEEAHGNAGMTEKIIARAVKSLQANGVVISREGWLAEAEAAERANPPMVDTCVAIVKAMVGLGVEDEDRKRTWMGDAEEALRRGSVHTARAVYAVALATFPGKPSVWRAAAALEKSHGTRAQLEGLLQRAVTYCPQSQVLWLMAAKEKWLGGDVGGARELLAAAFAANPDSEDIWLAAFKLEFENGEVERARALLAKARASEASCTARVWMKSALVERAAGDAAAERALLEEGIRRFPAFPKLWLMLGQLEQRNGATEAARAAYGAGLKRCADSVALWRAAAALEEGAGNVGRARAVLEQARHRNPGDEELWLAAVRTETRCGFGAAAEALLAKALQECPTSGRLWAEAVGMAPRPARKARVTDAIKRCDNNAHVVAATAVFFWQDRHVTKARSWFNRAVTLDPDWGDHWALFYKFELQHGGEEGAAAVLERVRAADPRHGERWTRVAKDVANARQPVDAILKKVLVDLDTRPPP